MGELTATYSSNLLEVMVWAEKIESRRKNLLPFDDFQSEQFCKSLRHVVIERPSSELHERIAKAAKTQNVFGTQSTGVKNRRLRGLATVIAIWVKDLQLPKS